MADKLKNDVFVEDRGNGIKRSYVQTPTGPKVFEHIGGSTRELSAAESGIVGVKASTPGGGAQRVTLHKDDGSAVDHTRSADGSIDTTIHEGDHTRKP